MLHLLTEEHKRKIVKQYRMRILVVLCMCLAVTFLAGIVFLVPSYVISFGAYSDVQSQKTNMTKLVDAKQTDEAANYLKEVSDVIYAIRLQTSKKDPSKVIERISQGKPSGISITSFNFTPDSDMKASVEVVGKASNRAALSAYIDQLKKDKVFSGVTIPLSSFARERDIGFNLNLQVDMNPELWLLNASQVVEKVDPVEPEPVTNTVSAATTSAQIAAPVSATTTTSAATSVSTSSSAEINTNANE